MRNRKGVDLDEKRNGEKWDEYGGNKKCKKKNKIRYLQRKKPEELAGSHNRYI